MKRKTFGKLLRDVKTVEGLDKVAEMINREWAGDHKGRLKLVTMLEEKRRRLEARKEG